MERLPEISLAQSPDRILMLIDEDHDTEVMAYEAVDLAKSRMPKVTGHAASTLQPIHGKGFFGIYFPDRRVWFLEQGIKPFTMNSLAGRTIPMWIDDPTGSERKANPKADTRETKDGRIQVLIFRRAALKGQRRTVLRRGADGLPRPVTVPMSYPGAAGRIARRQAARPHTTAGKQGGQIATANVGVRWRHPGITGRLFLNSALADIAMENGIEPVPLYLCDAASLFQLIRS